MPVRGKELTTEQRAAVLALQKHGVSYRQIATTLNVSLGVVCQTVQRKRETGSLCSRSRSGRPRSTSQRDDRKILQEAKRTPHVTAVQLRSRLSQHLQTVSKWLIRRRLAETCLRSSKPAKKPLLSAKNISDRVAVCKHWTAE